MTLADDPFEAFGDDDDDVDVDGSTAAVQETNPNQRDKSCGALVFREGTEQALLHYVRNQLDHPSSRSCSRISSASDSETISAREQVLQAVDDFCYSRHWMMHIGPLKGVVLQDFLTRRVETYIQAADFTYPLVIVEIGTYCGYSAVRMCQTVLAKLASAGDDDDHSLAKASFYVFTVDVDPGNVAVARQLVALAGVESYVEFLVLDTDGNAPPDQLSVKLQAAMTERFPDRQEATADFVFIDHAKELYLDDLLQLETSSIIRAGTAVAADNILFFRLDDYRQHMQALAEASIVETRLCEGHLEYLDDQDHLENNGMDLRDGLGK
jgi:catechol O-methyltransferase